jgi:hypothetical protein
MQPTTAPALIGAALLAAGCSHLPSGGLQDALDVFTPSASGPRVPIHLDPAPRPAVRAGDTYIYGAASVRRVSAVSATALTWTTTDGHSLRTGRDFFTPLLEQTLPDQRLTSRLSGQPGAMWPLAVGKKVTFEESRTTRMTVLAREVSTQLRWECEVVDTRLSQVPAGDFETYHVACKAYRSGFFLPVQSVTWDYAPSLGHYVRRTWFEGGRPRQAVLAAALPAPLATPPRIAATLERLRQMQQP